MTTLKVTKNNAQNTQVVRNSFEQINSDTETDRILREYFSLLKENQKNHLGYPLNFKYDYDKLIPFLNFTLNNLGDPYVNGNYKLTTKTFEQKVINFFSELYFLDKTQRWGYVTTSGTEGNLYGILLGREKFPEAKLYFSEDTHYSIAKAARYFRIQGIKIKSQINGEIDYQNFKEQLDQNQPAIINLNLSTTFKGAYDNLDKILEIIESKKIKDFYIHCDGALGGLILPFLSNNYPSFKKPIHSLSISGHKFLGCPFPSGVVITKKELVDNIANEIDVLFSKDTTIGGSRNGHLPLFLWYAISQRKNNFVHEVEDCIAKSKYFLSQLTQKGIPCLMNPYSPIVVFPKPEQKIIEKYQLMISGNQAHVVILQNHTYEFLHEFINELKFI